MKTLLDKEGTVLENKDLVIADGETNPEQVLKYSGIWYMANYPSEKGTLFNLAEFTTKETDNDVTLVEYTKYIPKNTHQEYLSIEMLEKILEEKSSVQAEFIEINADERYKIKLLSQDYTEEELESIFDELDLIFKSSGWSLENSLFVEEDRYLINYISMI